MASRADRESLEARVHELEAELAAVREQIKSLQDLMPENAQAVLQRLADEKQEVERECVELRKRLRSLSEQASRYGQ